MTAINWLATQLAWEQRLVELRSEGRPSTFSLVQTPDAREARKAA